MRKIKEFWYVIEAEGGFTSFIPAKTSREARILYSGIYYGKVLSARRATKRDWNRNETLWFPLGDRRPKRSRVLRHKMLA